MATPKDLNDPVEAYEGLLEHPDTDRQKIAVAIDSGVKAVGHVVMWANVLLMAAIFSQVSLRYLFSQNYPQAG